MQTAASLPVLFLALPAGATADMFDRRRLLIFWQAWMLATVAALSVLTMLGVVIGVGAVIAVVALGRGAQESVNARIAALGTTLLTVLPGQIYAPGGVSSGNDRAPMKVADALALDSAGPPISAVEPEMQKQLQVQYLNTNTNTSVLGTTPNYLEVRKYSMQYGKMFTEGLEKQLALRWNHFLESALQFLGNEFLLGATGSIRAVGLQDAQTGGHSAGPC
jgi:ABC-type lipoprotein release transport system permease subunit